MLRTDRSGANKAGPGTSEETQYSCYQMAALFGYRAGSRAALPTLPGGEMSAIMMTTLTQQAIRAVPTPQIVLPSAHRASQAPQPKPRHQLRVPKDRRRQMATEEPLPVYTRAPAGPPSSQSHPFSSQLLSSAQIEREGISWLLLQGWEGYDSLMRFGATLQTGDRPSQCTLGYYYADCFHLVCILPPGCVVVGISYQSWQLMCYYLHIQVHDLAGTLKGCLTHQKTDACGQLPAGSISEYSVQSSASSTAQIKPGDKLTGRYYQASGQAAVQAAAAAAAATASNAAEASNAHEAERSGRLADLERRVAANPGNEELWLLFALQHIDFGAVESMQGELYLIRSL